LAGLATRSNRHTPGTTWSCPQTRNGRCATSACGWRTGTGSSRSWGSAASCHTGGAWRRCSPGVGHRQDDGGRGGRARAAVRSVPSGPSGRHQQVDRRDREEPRPHLHSGRARERDPAFRRGGRLVRQAFRGAGLARSVRQYRGVLSAAEDGGVRRGGSTSDEPGRRPRRGVPAPNCPLRSGSRFPSPRSGCGSGQAYGRTRHRWPTTSTGTRWRTRYGSAAPRSRTWRSERRSSQQRTAVR